MADNVCNPLRSDNTLRLTALAKIMVQQLKPIRAEAIAEDSTDIYVESVKDSKTLQVYLKNGFQFMKKPKPRTDETYTAATQIFQAMKPEGKKKNKNAAKDLRKKIDEILKKATNEKHKKETICYLLGNDELFSNENRDAGADAWRTFKDPQGTQTNLNGKSRLKYAEVCKILPRPKIQTDGFKHNHAYFAIINKEGTTEEQENWDGFIALEWNHTGKNEIEILCKKDAEPATLEVPQALNGLSTTWLKRLKKRAAAVVANTNGYIQMRSPECPPNPDLSDFSEKYNIYPILYGVCHATPMVITPEENKITYSQRHLTILMHSNLKKCKTTADLTLLFKVQKNIPNIPKKTNEQHTTPSVLDYLRKLRNFYLKDQNIKYCYIEYDKTTAAADNDTTFLKQICSFLPRGKTRASNAVLSESPTIEETFFRYALGQYLFQRYPTGEKVREKVSPVTDPYTLFKLRSTSTEVYIDIISTKHKFTGTVQDMFTCIGSNSVKNELFTKGKEKKLKGNKKTKGFLDVSLHYTEYTTDKGDDQYFDTHEMEQPISIMISDENNENNTYELIHPVNLSDSEHLSDPLVLPRGVLEQLCKNTCCTNLHYRLYSDDDDDSDVTDPTGSFVTADEPAEVKGNGDPLTGSFGPAADNAGSSSDSSSNSESSFADDTTNTPLHKACHAGLLGDVRLELQKEDGIDVNEGNKNGATPLFVACWKGHTGIARVLLDEGGATVDQADKDGATPLFVACQNGHTETASVLLDSGATVDQARNDGVTPLYVACQEGHTETASVLLDQGGATVDLAKNDGTTPLYIACQEGQTETASVLLNHGANPNQADKDGYTPLWIACQNGHTNIVKVLLDRGADPNQADKDGTTPLCIACQNEHTDIASVLLNRGANPNQAEKGGYTALYVACENACENDIVNVLLNRGADPNQADDAGLTPLHTACDAGNMEIVQALLDYENIQVNVENKDKNTPLHIACADGHILIVQALLGKDGIRVNVQNKDKNTPLHIAVKKDHTAIVQALLANNNIQVNATTNVGTTPLHIACWYGYKDIVTMLLAHAGIRVNAIGNDGNTPLHVALKAGKKAVDKNAANKDEYKEIVILLLDHGASLYIQNVQKKTSMSILPTQSWLNTFSFGVFGAPGSGDLLTEYNTLHRAVKFNNIEDVKALLPAADVNAANEEDRDTPLHLACQKGHLNIVDLLLGKRGIYVDATNNVKDTPLHLACQHGHLGIVKRLLNEKADIAAQDEYERTPLRRAESAGKARQAASAHAAIADLLYIQTHILYPDIAESTDIVVANTVDRNIANTVKQISTLQKEQTPEQTHDAVPLFKTLQTYLRHRKSLFNACTTGDNVNKIVEDIREYVHTRNNKGQTLLHVACLNGHKENVVTLVEKGADINARDNDGQTPLHVACMRKHVDVVIYLLRHGRVDINARDNDGWTPLHVASANNHNEVVAYLLGNGRVDINARDNDGRTPLHVAHADVVFTLLDNGAAINARDNDGQTPLHLACTNVNEEGVKALLKNGADMTARDNNGKMPHELTENENIQGILQEYLKDMQKLFDPIDNDYSDDSEL